jgi:putative endonuclease
MECCTYILFSEKMDRFYVGATKNMDQRLAKHLQSNKGFTARAKDLEVVHLENFNTRSEALARVKEIKNWKSREMIEKLISS